MFSVTKQSIIFWSAIENLIDEEVPVYIKNILRLDFLICVIKRKQLAKTFLNLFLIVLF